MGYYLHSNTQLRQFRLRNIIIILDAKQIEVDYILPKTLDSHKIAISFRMPVIIPGIISRLDECPYAEALALVLAALIRDFAIYAHDSRALL